MAPSEVLARVTVGVVTADATRMPQNHRLVAPAAPTSTQRNGPLTSANPVPIDRSGCRSRNGRHNRTSYQKHGCRCPDACEAARLYRKRGLEGRRAPEQVDSTGTARRLQALAAIGWNLEELAAELGWKTRTRVYQVRRQQNPRVTLATYRQVEALYERLCMSARPDKRVRNRASKDGWAPPLAWEGIDIDDPAAKPEGVGFKVTTRKDDFDRVELYLALAGKLPPHRTCHRPIVLRKAVQLLASKESAPAIAQRLHLAQRTVERIIAELRQLPPQLEDSARETENAA